MPNCSDSDRHYIYFPYPKMREFQANILSNIKLCLTQRKNAVFEAGTGTGKTITVLVPTIEYAIKNDKRIIYLTRTNSQERQVIEECRAIWDRIHDLSSKEIGIGTEKILVLALQGRTHLCPFTKGDNELELATAEELSLLCRKLRYNTLKVCKENYKGNEDLKICPYFKTTLDIGIEQYFEYLRNDLPTAEQIVERIVSDGLCPYEVIKKYVSKAVVVVAPYIYILTPVIRSALMKWMNTNITETIVIVDEAHNLPGFARDVGSAELSIISIDRALKEVENLDIETSNEVKVIDFFDTLRNIIYEIRDEYLIDEDGFVPRDYLHSEIMFTLGITSQKLANIVVDLIRIGEEIKEEKLRIGRLPRSYIHSTATFLNLWNTVEERTHVLLVKSIGHGDINPKLEIFCLDPSYITTILNKTSTTIHMSGTLRPIEEYISTVNVTNLGFQYSFPSPFPKDNRKVFYVKGVTTRYEDLKKRGNEIYEKLRRILWNILSEFTDRNTLVLFPSYGIYQGVMPDDFMAKIDGIRPCYFDNPTVKQVELMTLIKAFKQNKGSVLFSVIGGRISEGMDFPAKTLEIVVIVGIPYPKPTARQKAIEYFYEWKFRKGWEYGVRAPALRRILQALGRLIRSEYDRGIAVILDERAAAFKDEIVDLYASNDVIKDIHGFFEST